MLAPAALADPISVFGSPGDDGAPPAGGVYALYGVANQDIQLWMVGGNVPSTSPFGPCADRDSQGGEVCGVQFNVYARNGAILNSWVPDPKWLAEGHGGMFFERTPTQLTAQAFVVQPPITVAPRKLGTLRVSSVSAPDADLVVDGEGVAADLSGTQVITQVFAAPEPGFGTGLVSGVLALGALARRRRRRA
jgi:hypothetical protein